MLCSSIRLSPKVGPYGSLLEAETYLRRDRNVSSVFAVQSEVKISFATVNGTLPFVSWDPNPPCCRDKPIAGSDKFRVWVLYRCQKRARVWFNRFRRCVIGSRSQPVHWVMTCWYCVNFSRLKSTFSLRFPSYILLRRLARLGTTGFERGLKAVQSI